MYLWFKLIPKIVSLASVCYKKTLKYTKEMTVLFLKFWIILCISVALAVGVKESSTVNSLFTIINVGVVLFVIIAGSFKGKQAALQFLCQLKHDSLLSLC